MLAQRLSRLGEVRLSQQDFDVSRLPPHLRITFVVHDNDGRPVAAGKDLEALQRRLRGGARQAVAEAVGGIEVAGLQAWTIGSIPAQVEAQWHGHRVTAYPALVDEGDSVALRVLTTPTEQARHMLLGTRRLLLLTLPSPTKALRRVFTNETRLALALTPYRTIDDLLSDCVACAIDRLIAANGGPAWDEAGFLALRTPCDDLVDAAVDIGTVVASVVMTVRRSRIASPATARRCGRRWPTSGARWLVSWVRASSSPRAPHGCTTSSGTCAPSSVDSTGWATAQRAISS